jgi:hypothetical protein
MAEQVYYTKREGKNDVFVPAPTGVPLDIETIKYA